MDLVELIIGGIILFGVATIICDLIVLCLWSVAIVAIASIVWYVGSKLTLTAEAKRLKS